MDTPRRQTLVDDVVQIVRQMILDGEIVPGGYLPARKTLAARLGVGVSTVHEAVGALAAVGLLDSRPGKGTWVRPDALETLIHPSAVETRLGKLRARQIYEARATIEVALTELAAQRATPEDLEHIFQSLNEMEAVIDDDLAFVEADLAFHLAVARAAHSDLLEQFYHLSRKLLTEIIERIIQIPSVKEEGTAIQRRIGEAIVQHNAPRARRAAEEHMAIIEKLVESTE
jgi:GntR family transcriptional repressor for pyruvate dehydrogenase complex